MLRFASNETQASFYAPPVRWIGGYFPQL